MEANNQISSHDGDNIYRFFKRLLNLRADTDREGTIDLIKANVEFRSANAWTLVFAIVIASVGLNVNSTAVVIGAMLISPLMGPIIGTGFALGTYDFPLLKKSSKNLAAAVGISLTASTIYFLISPISEVQSELLARTRPSFYDVLIAFFGGAAGIVAISRKEKGNAIPGVAIATALMPPLCTAGFGLATRNLGYFFGAMYLFVINSVFIAISTLLFIRYLNFHKVQIIDSKKQQYINRWITWVGISVMVPSFFMAWYLQRESTFKVEANKYIKQELQSTRRFVVDRDISFSLRDPQVIVSLLGEPLSQDEIADLKSRAKKYSIPPKAVVIRQSTYSENLEKKIGEKIFAAEGETSRLQAQLKKYEMELGGYKNLIDLSNKVTSEMKAVFPGKISHVYVIKQNVGAEDTYNPKELRVLTQWKSAPKGLDEKRATSFLVQRLEVSQDQVVNLREF